MVHILLGITGSVASIKLDELVSQLSQIGEVRVVYTESAAKFTDIKRRSVPVFTFDFGQNAYSESDYNSSCYDPERMLAYGDEHEWMWSKKGDPILHIELRKWADLFVIAPMSANSLAKMVNGISDNLLTSILRAWDFQKPLTIAPAMNTLMWKHPITAIHLNVLESWGVNIISPISKTLMCGDSGIGAMAEVTSIVERVTKIAPRTFSSRYKLKKMLKISAVVLVSFVGIWSYYKLKRLIVGQSSTENSSSNSK